MKPMMRWQRGSPSRVMVVAITGVAVTALATTLAAFSLSNVQDSPGACESQSVDEPGERCPKALVRLFEQGKEIFRFDTFGDEDYWGGMVTSAGGGYSSWRQLAITRWREDATCDNWGSFCYLRDVASGDSWSTAFQPTLQPADKAEVLFSEGHAVFGRRDHGIETRTQIAVAPDDDVEVRQVVITNASATHRILDITSYAEIVLAPAAVDAAHTAFAKLFVETAIVRDHQAILFKRRPRTDDEVTPWLFHLLSASSGDTRDVSYETDRMRFIGRGRTVADPQAMQADAPLSGSAGSVLDPIASIRCRVSLAPGETATVDLIVGVGETREACLALAGKCRERAFVERTFDGATVRAQATLRAIGAADGDAQRFRRLATSIVYANAALRADPAILGRNTEGQPGLWAHSISGDLPIVLLRIADAANIGWVHHLLRARAYWRLHAECAQRELR